VALFSESVKGGYGERQRAGAQRRGGSA